MNTIGGDGGGLTVERSVGVQQTFDRSIFTEHAANRERTVENILVFITIGHNDDNNACRALF